MQQVAKHYHEEIDKLLAAKLTPFVTLHHFTNPTWFQKKGAFENEANIVDFVNYAKRAFQEFGGKVKHWMTINEPEVITSGGYFMGDMPPGKQDWQLAATHLRNLMEAHVQAYHAMKGTTALLAPPSINSLCVYRIAKRKERTDRHRQKRVLFRTQQRLEPARAIRRQSPPRRLQPVDHQLFQDGSL